MWWIGIAVVLVGSAFYWQGRRPKTFSYRGRRYTRHGDGSFTYYDGGTVDRDEIDDVRDHWDSTHDSGSSDGGSSDGGGGHGGGGGD